MAVPEIATVVVNAFDSVLKIGELEIKKFTAMGAGEAQDLASRINAAIAAFNAPPTPPAAPPMA